MPTKESNSALIVKSNDLINAKLKGFSISQHRLLDILISQLDKDQGSFHKQRVYFKDFVEQIGTNHKGESIRAREVTKALMRKVIEVSENGNIRQRNIFYSADYYEDKPYVEVIFHPDLRPYLLELSKNFTSYDLRNTLSVKSTYSVRMYQLLKQYAYRGKVTFELEELKELLDAENYNLYADFKRNCLKIAEKELRKKCDISFSFQEIKQGRKVAKIAFDITVSGDKEAYMLSGSRKGSLLKDLIELGVNRKQAESFVENYKQEDILEKIIYTRSQYEKGKVKNPGGYIKTLLENEAVIPVSIVQDHRTPGKKNSPTDRKRIQRDRQLIDKLKVDFEGFRSRLRKEAIKNLNASDYKEFEAFVKGISGAGSIFNNDGTLNQKAEKYEHYLDIFSTRKLPEYNKQFVEWVYNHHGYVIKLKPDSNSDFEVTSYQPGLF
jgi:plasmid replication initiation protein